MADTRSTRALLALAGLLGAAGVGLAAAAAHRGGDDSAMNAALLLGIHAAALVGLSSHGGPFVRVGAMLAAGVALFSGDIAARAFLGTRLFPMAAPIGGTLMILAWLGVAATALLAGDRDNS